jgi:hypothetical protein
MSSHRGKPTPALLAASALLAIGFSSLAYGHGFGQRYDLPLPLWLYLTGAALAVVFSFVVMALSVRSVSYSSARLDLRELRPGLARATTVVRHACGTCAVALYVVVIAAGLFGVQSPLKNIAPAMVWAIWWVGMAYVSALLGNVWALCNPVERIYAWCEAIAQLHGGQRSRRGLAYRPMLGVWPAVALFLVFTWMELVWEGSDTPASLAVAMLAYSMLTWIAMFLFGRVEWLRRGEVFNLVFGLLARFAPLEVRCAGVAKGEGDSRCELHLRPYAVGLGTEHPVSLSLVVLVVAMLATVSFDGFIETPTWAAVSEAIVRGIGAEAGDQRSQTLAKTLGLVAAPLVFLGVYLAFCVLIIWFGRRSIEPARGVLKVAGLFVLTLVPIAIAYHLAHYLSFLIMAWQYMIPLASDPFGFGWDLFGTARHFVRLGIVDARLVWYVSVAAIVIGHIAAVYLAHLQALREFPDKRAALRSQYPMLALMVCYTMLSLWIIAQPIVTSR